MARKKKKLDKHNYSAKLDRVVDGDTCDALIDLGFNTFVKKRIRFFGVDTWESRTRNLEEKKKGLAAKEFTKDLLENSDNGKFVIKNHLVYSYFISYFSIYKYTNLFISICF